MTGLRIDDDVVLWSVDGRRATGQEALAALRHRPLLLMLHGFGSFEGDLISLAPNLPHGFVCASPRALLVAPPPIVNGYAWWPLPLGPDGLPLRQPGPERFEGSAPHEAAVALLEWIDELSERVREQAGEGPDGPGLGTIAMLGFSQGGCMVTSLLRLRPERFACGVNCSGFVAPGAFDGDAALAAVRPPMFWGRDEADPIIDETRIALTAVWAPEHTALDAKLYDGILHGIGVEELADIAAFLEAHVPDATAGAR